MSGPHRFLLDQNFPHPRFDVTAVDATVDYVPVAEFDPTLVEAQTPDWLIVLRTAEVGGFAGIVTRDASQLDVPEVLVALTRTDLAIVTWRAAIEDAIQEWGQMLAYMPLVLERIVRDGPAIFYLPKPSLSTSNIARASALLGEHASRQRRSRQEVMDESLTIMRAELEARDLSRLQALLG